MTEISIENLFIILFILLLLSAFLSGSETSLMSVNRYKLKHRFKLGEKSAEKVNFLVSNPDKTLGLILLLNNFQKKILKISENLSVIAVVIHFV